MTESKDINEAIRDREAQSGDIVLVHNHRSIVSWAIQKATDSPWNHCGILHVRGEKAFISEALPSGVALSPLSKYLDKKKYTVTIARYQNPTTGYPLTSEQRQSIIDWQYDQLGDGYNFSALAGILWNIWWKRTHKDNSLADHAENRFICSRLVARDYKKAAGIKLIWHASETEWNLAPGGIGRSLALTHASGDMRMWLKGRI